MGWVSLGRARTKQRPFGCCCPHKLLLSWRLGGCLQNSELLLQLSLIPFLLRLVSMGHSRSVILEVTMWVDAGRCGCLLVRIWTESCRMLWKIILFIALPLPEMTIFVIGCYCYCPSQIAVLRGKKKVIIENFVPFFGPGRGLQLFNWCALVIPAVLLLPRRLSPEDFVTLCVLGHICS